MDDHPGVGLKAARERRKARPEETRRATNVLSRDTLAKRCTGADGYVPVSLDTIKAAEEGTRNPGDDTLAALYHALGEVTPEEWPAGALAETRYLAARWLDEREVGLEVALARRQALDALMSEDDAATQFEAEAQKAGEPHVERGGSPSGERPGAGEAGEGP